jgi:cyclic lactone autoinducer peptide
MKKVAYYASAILSVVAVFFAISDSALFVNKPQAPKELLKK